ncbi:MAG: flagellar basal body-associated protein FliL [Pusillimonas sp.]|jgi:flagellar FliL protein|nr:flagellar basal body-associated protein FliL [Pusillimonas sp.]MBC43079.1 flagellar basal body-associated protein FliL [Pusillimonas sp.]HCN72559.1 flagellar basal body-associated protein FliL [Pusillimonas sp.]HCP77808.1 flagellar basal body-associated protein FliL [Pusillimonas sp.]|tara:strand:- start:45 stop:509 length:465 start_codon:yes stop_codon:yes gene_type:complete
MKLLKISLLVIAVIAVTLGSTFYYLSATGVLGTSEAQAQQSDVEAAPPIKPVFLPLEPFTVTLRDNDSLSRILYVEITLRTSDEASKLYLEEYMPEVRNRVITALSSYSPDFLQTNDGRATLAQEIQLLLQEPYEPDPTQAKLTRVLFTAFVIQ